MGDGSPHRRMPTSWGGRGVLPRRWSLPMECLPGTAAPSGPGPRAGGTDSAAPVAVGAYGAPVGDGCPHRRGPTSWGDGESCLRGGRCLWSACRARQPSAAGTHRLGGRGVLPRWRSVPMEGLRGTHPVWCGVVWCGVPKVLLPEGNGREVYPRV